MGLEVITVSWERPHLQAHRWDGHSDTRTILYTPLHTHTYMSLCQDDLTLRQRRHAGKGKWRLRALITVDLGAVGEAGGADHGLFQL